MSQPYQNPPAPGYGGAYGATYYSPQSPYGPRPPYSPSPYPQHGAHPPAPFQSAPADGFNVARFDANSQAHPQAQPFSFAPTSFPPEMLKQFANSSIPPPPPPPGFPPLSFPNINFPLFPPMPTAPSQAYSPSQQVASDDGSDAYDPRYPQSILQTSRQVGGQGSSKRQSQFQAPLDALQSVAHGGLYTEPTYQEENVRFPPNLDGASLSTQIRPQYLPPPNLVNVNTVVGNVLSEFGPSETQPSSGLVHPAQIRSPRNDSVIPPAVSQEPPQIMNSEREIEQPRHDYDKMNADELRVLAKGALVSLAPHNIALEELVKEGINSNVLSALYTELGLPTKPSQPATEHLKPNENASNPTSKSGNLEALAQVPSTASPSLERKDRIAQLLAAKAGRPNPVRTESESSKSALAQDTARSNLQSGEYGIGATDATEDTTTGLKSKGIAQAELVRHEMELLRKPISETLVEQSSLAEGNEAQPNRSKTATGDAESTLPSTLPGLGMMSVDSDPVPSIVPSKRTLDADRMMNDAVTKRPNFGTSLRSVEVKTDTDQPISQEASDGEVIESPRPVEAQRPPKGQEIASFSGAEPKLAVSTAKPFSPVSGTKLTPAQMAEKAKQLKAKFLQQRARQQALQEGIPDLAAEVARTEDLLTTQRSQLEETRQRIKALELDLQNARQQEQDQLVQILRSEEQVQQGVSGQKKFAQELQTLSHQQSSVNRSLNDAQQASGTRVTAADDKRDAVPKVVHDAPLPIQDGNVKADLSPAAGSEPSGDIQMHQEHQVDPVVQASGPKEDGNNVEVSDISSVSMGATTDESAGAEDQGVAEDQAYTGPTGESAMGTPLEQSIADDVESDGSASMMDSASDSSQDEGEYSPPEDDPTQPMDLDDGSSEDYDPSEAPVDFVQGHEEPQPGDSALGAPNLPEGNQTLLLAPEGAIDTDVEPTAVEDGLDLIAQQEFYTNIDPPRTNGSDTDYRPSRSSAPATPNGRWARGRKRPAVKPLSNTGAPRSTSFSTYESPLTSFPSYRYNENYSDTTKDGYRSLTYSNSIDPRTPLCPTELSGETCLDSTCEEQHFRHLGLSDDKILAQMSSANEFTDKDHRDRYLLGLKEIIADLRSRNVRDFEDVAKALSEYRRKFVANL